MPSRKQQKQLASQVASILRKSPDLYSMSKGQMTELRKALLTVKQVSNQGETRGLIDHPFSKIAVRSYGDANPHHAACINAKVSAIVGQGHKNEKVAEVLDPLCEHSLADLETSFCEDYCETGDAFIEVVRPEGEEDVISGLHHMPAADAYIYLEDQADLSKRHFEVLSSDLTIAGKLRFARFGDREDMITRLKIEKDSKVSELIHWRRAKSKSRWYGYPDYFSAVPSIELVQAMTQHEFNFFFNNGVPEFLVFVLGSIIPGPDWEKFVGMLRANQGLRNSQRSQAANFPNVKGPDSKVQIEKLGAGSDSDTSQYAVYSDVTAANIVTAHGVPPVLAGIQFPGKMGAANETPNALLLFHLMKTLPAQRALSYLLASTLGNKQKFLSEEGKAQTLTREDFLGSSDDKGNGFNTIIDEINLGAMDTMGRMKEPIMGSGRDPSKGLLTSSDGRSKTGGKPTSGTGKAQAAGRGKPKPKK